MKRLAKTTSIQFQSLALGILTILLILACQSNPDRQSSNPQSLSDCRTVQHALGQVCIPREPMRLVGLDETTLADAAVLQVPLVGVSVPPRAEIDQIFLTGSLKALFTKACSSSKRRKNIF